MPFIAMIRGFERLSDTGGARDAAYAAAWRACCRKAAKDPAFRR
jgi:hypothetical protein